MELLSACLKQSISNCDFSPHWRTKEVDLHHLIFGDDVFLFCQGDIASVSALFQSLRTFSSLSGLHINTSKSQCFYGNVPVEVVSDIQYFTHIAEGDLLVRYLGLPLLCTKLSARDCSPLANSFCSRTETWTTTFLNFAGRLQLV